MRKKYVEVQIEFLFSDIYQDDFSVLSVSNDGVYDDYELPLLGEDDY